MTSLQQSVHSFKNNLAPDAPLQALCCVTPGEHVACRGSGDVYMAMSLDTRDFHFHLAAAVSSTVPRGVCVGVQGGGVEVAAGISLVAGSDVSLWGCCTIGHGKVLLQHHQRVTKL